MKIGSYHRKRFNFVRRYLITYIYNAENLTPIDFEKSSVINHKYFSASVIENHTDFNFRIQIIREKKLKSDLIKLIEIYLICEILNFESLYRLLTLPLKISSFALYTHQFSINALLRLNATKNNWLGLFLMNSLMYHIQLFCLAQLT